MSTRVVNLRAEEFDVYIGRAGHGLDGTFGNPYVKGLPCARCQEVHEDASSTIPCFKAYFGERVETDLAFRARVLALRGKRLGCFCKPRRCHGDVIVAWLDGWFSMEGRTAP